jgi:hypothetical protein
MKIRTKIQLQDLIQLDKSWRIQELVNTKIMIFNARGAHQHTLIRAGILLLYSHWEGFIKKSTELFFTYLNCAGVRYIDLNKNLISLGIYDEFESDFPQKQFKSFLITTEFITEGIKNKNFKLNIEKHIDTKSNLNSEVLLDLTKKIGIDCTVFQNERFHIDNRLLKFRNSIAHGERTDNNPDLFITREEFFELHDKINELISVFETLLLNHCELDLYKNHLRMNSLEAI